MDWLVFLRTSSLLETETPPSLWLSDVLTGPEEVSALSPPASCLAAFFLVFSSKSSIFFCICLRRSRAISMIFSKSTSTGVQRTNRPILTRHSPSAIGMVVWLRAPQERLKVGLHYSENMNNSWGRKVTIYLNNICMEWRFTARKKQNPIQCEFNKRKLRFNRKSLKITKYFSFMIMVKLIVNNIGSGMPGLTPIKFFKIEKLYNKTGFSAWQHNYSTSILYFVHSWYSATDGCTVINFVKRVKLLLFKLMSSCLRGIVAFCRSFHKTSIHILCIMIKLGRRQFWHGFNKKNNDCWTAIPHSIWTTNVP